MKFSKMCDYLGKPHFICKTGRKNIRILEVGLSYDKSFVVPINRIANRRPADVVFDDESASEEPLDLETPVILDRPYAAVSPFLPR